MNVITELAESECIGLYGVILLFSSEEISFYQGSAREQQNIRKMFGRLVS